jgi:DnaJ-class molecular chaperone
VKVRIPAGVETGSRVRISGKGEGGRMGAQAGDLHIITNVGTHKYFTRKGDNIYVTVPITVPEAALGAKIEVPTVDGKTQLRVPPGTQSGQKFRLRDRGAPSLRNPGAKGHQFVEVQVTLPKVISEETKTVAAGQPTMSFTSGSTSSWAKGDYTADIWIGDEKVNTQHFNIVDKSEAGK